MAAFKRDSNRATEAGLKYFVLGALSSGMLLYGSSMIYGFAGATSFPLIAQSLKAMLSGGEPVSIGLIVGIVFLSARLAFKASTVRVRPLPELLPASRSEERRVGKALVSQCGYR